MQITVILHSILREKLPPEARGRVIIDLPPESVVADVFRRLNLPAGVAWALNGELARDLNLLLHEGDELRVFRIGAGGSSSG